MIWANSLKRNVLRGDFMFKVIDMCDCIHEAYGTFIDSEGDVQFILCNSFGEFYKTDSIKGYYKLYEEPTEYDLNIIFPQTIGDITFYDRHELIEWVINQQKLNKERISK